jgi:CheY-like chemotaxis protein
VADVLVVDDQPELAAMTALVLRRAGHRVRTAASGAEALAALAEAPARVVVLDLDMPGLSGWEVLAAIRDDARARPTRVLLYSSAASLAPPTATIPQPDAVLAKSAAPRQLVAAVAALT